MKKNHSLGSLLILSGFIMSPAIVTASVPVPKNPSGIFVDVTCPGVHGISNVLTNFGSYVAGYGQESMSSQPSVPVYFTSSYLPPTVPHSLIYYFNETATYDSTTGVVTCSYLSSQSDPGFSVNYYVTNGKGGAINMQAANTLEIVFPFGLTA